MCKHVMYVRDLNTCVSRCQGGWHGPGEERMEEPGNQSPYILREHCIAVESAITMYHP